MFKRNQIQNALLIAGAAVVSTAALAQTNTTTTASVTVQNAFNVTKGSDLSFGTITAINASGSSRTLVMKPDGTTEDGNGTGDPLVVLTVGTPATYSVTGAAPFTILKANVNGAVTLTNATAPGSNPDFIVDSFQVTDGVATERTVSTTAEALVGMQTDVNGELDLNLGAQLTLPSATNNDPLIDGLYSGTFTFTLQY